MKSYTKQAHRQKHSVPKNAKIKQSEILKSFFLAEIFTRTAAISNYIYLLLCFCRLQLFSQLLIWNVVTKE